MFKAGVIGTGQMGRHHVRNYFEIPQVKLVAISDLDEKKGKDLASKYQGHFYKNYKEMLKKEKIDVISIAVPTKLHKEVALDCIKKGLHVLVEKPIALNVEEAEEIIEAANKNKVKLMIGHIERFNPAVRKIKELIKKRRLGKIKSITSKRVGLVPPRIKDSNVVLDIGTHDIDILNFLYGSLPTEVFASGGKALLNYQEDYADIFLKYPQSSSGHIEVNWITPVKIRKLLLTGTKGYLEADYISQKILLFEHGYSQQFGNFEDFVLKYGNQEKKGELIKVELKEPLRAELEAFIEAIKKDQEPSCSGQDGLEALRIALIASYQMKGSTKIKF